MTEAVAATGPRAWWIWAAGLGTLVALGRLEPGMEGVVIGLAVLLAVGLMHLAVGALDVRFVSFPAFWLLTYLATVLVPGLIEATGRQDDTRGRFLLAIVATLVLVPCGMLVVNLVTRFSAREVRAYVNAPVLAEGSGLVGRSLFVIAGLIGLLFVGLYVREVQTLPLFYLLKHPTEAAQVVFLREDAFKLLDSPFLYAYDVLRRVGFPMLVGIAFGQYLVTRQRWWLLAFVAVTALGVFFAALSLAKAPVALIALIGCFCWYVHRGGRLGLRALLLGVGLVFLFPLTVLLFLKQKAGVGVGVLVSAILQRLFALPSDILYTYFSLFPHVLPFLHGRTIGRVSWLMGVPNFDLTNYVFNYMNPGGVLSGSAPAGFLGFFYADFGMAGVLIGAVLTGMIIQAIHVFLVRRPRTVTHVAAYGFMYWAFWQVNLAALPTTLLSGGVFFVIVGLVLGRAAASTARAVLRTGREGA